MKRIVLSVLLTLGMTVPMATPAQAIFGLSTCEKVKNAISEEEKVGLELHKKYLEQRKIILGMKDANWTNMSDAFSWLPDVFDSDLRVFKLVDKNPTCFSAKDVARARTGTRSHNKAIKDIETIRKAVIKDSRISNTLLKKQQIDFIKKMYASYFSFVENKKLD